MQIHSFRENYSQFPFVETRSKSKPAVDFHASYGAASALAGPCSPSRTSAMPKKTSSEAWDMLNPLLSSFYDPLKLVYLQNLLAVGSQDK